MVSDVNTSEFVGESGNYQVNFNNEGSGAIGAMQIMPGHALNALKNKGLNVYAPFDNYIKGASIFESNLSGSAGISSRTDVGAVEAVSMALANSYGAYSGNSNNVQGGVVVKFVEGLTGENIANGGVYDEKLKDGLVVSQLVFDGSLFRLLVPNLEIGNGLAGETLFRVRGNRVSAAIASPNKVWERGTCSGCAATLPEHVEGKTRHFSFDLVLGQY